MNRWLRSERRDASEYDRRFIEAEQSGRDMHGEASFVESLGVRSVLDAGCGTGRVAIELARRGLDVVGVDLDPGMLELARTKAPHLTWLLDDLVTVRVPAGGTGVDSGLGEGAQLRQFEAVVAAGNVMIFLAEGTEAAVVANLASHLAPGGALVAGFQLDGHLSLSSYDDVCGRAGLELQERWATWDRDPWRDGGEYAVSVHRSAWEPSPEP